MNLDIDEAMNTLQARVTPPSHVGAKMAYLVHLILYKTSLYAWTYIKSICMNLAIELVPGPTPTKPSLC